MIDGLTAFIDNFNVVRQIPVFSRLNWFDAQKIARRVLIEEYKKGDFIRREGDPPDFLYCLVSGRLLAYTLGHNETRGNEDFIHQGMYFGILSLFTGENHSMNFEAMNDSVILKLPRDDFHALLKAMPHLAIEFSQALSKRMRRKVKGMSAVFESSIISVYSPVKGTGSSTYARHLASCLAEETGKKVILVSFHSQGQPMAPLETAASSFPPEAVPLKQIQENPERIKDMIQVGESGMDRLSVKFGYHEVQDASDAGTTLKKYIAPFVSSLGGNYHYVVVDLPNDMDDVVIETLMQSDRVHLLTLDRRKDLFMIRDVVKRLKINLDERFRDDKVRVILRATQTNDYLSFETVNKRIHYPVYTLLPRVSRADGNGDESGLEVRDPWKDTAYDKVVRYIAREIGEVLVGLVLGGGAALGLAHVGVLKVLEEENIPVDILVGSSMGALVGSLWAVGKKADELVAIASEFEKKSSVLRLIDPVFPVSGFIGGRAIRRWLKRHLGSSTFLSTKVPLKIVAYDLKHREELVINSGSIIDAVQKSIAIPGVICPVKQGRRVIIDGGVLNPLPTNVLTRLGIRRIISVNVLKSPEDVYQSVMLEEKGVEERLRRSFWRAPLSFWGYRLKRFWTGLFNPNISDIIVQTLQAAEYLIAEQSSQQADVSIHPDLVGVEWYEMYKVKDFIRRGEEAARSQLPALKALAARKE